MKDGNSDYPIEETAPYNPNPASLLEVSESMSVSTAIMPSRKCERLYSGMRT
ncbi:MAG: hypothetical protein LBQ01_04120 [Prevotellaceae bacterium]|nr:hypothetical protein [Prevotellaceae bacterium]